MCKQTLNTRFWKQNLYGDWEASWHGFAKNVSPFRKVVSKVFGITSIVHFYEVLKPVFIPIDMAEISEFCSRFERLLSMLCSGMSQGWMANSIKSNDNAMLVSMTISLTATTTTMTMTIMLILLLMLMVTTTTTRMMMTRRMMMMMMMMMMMKMVKMVNSSRIGTNCTR